MANGPHEHALSFCEGVAHGLKKSAEMTGKTEAYKEEHITSPDYAQSSCTLK